MRVVLLLVHAGRLRRQRARLLILDAISVGLVPEVAVVGDAHELVEQDLARLLVAVGAVGGAGGHATGPAQAARHALAALRGLVPVNVDVRAVGVDLSVGYALLGTGARQRVPHGRAASVLPGAALPIGLVLPEVAGDRERLHLAPHDEAVLVVDVPAQGRGAAARVVSHEGAELALVGVPELPRVLDGNLVAFDAIDAVLPWGRHDDLLVEVPEDAGQIRRVDVLQGIRGLALRAVHVKGLHAGTGRRRRRRRRLGDGLLCGLLP
mmetsp:Transcript_10535/g.29985  ORF Transcript_10535/g.29985 Transcript_10535/m.29985 type:complete len:266 (-) Transcript_10535:516-1313(-)